MIKDNYNYLIINNINYHYNYTNCIFHLNINKICNFRGSKFFETKLDFIKGISDKF